MVLSRKLEDRDILTIFLEMAVFNPQHSYKRYSYKKKRVSYFIILLI